MKRLKIVNKKCENRLKEAKNRVKVAPLNLHFFLRGKAVKLAGHEARNMSVNAEVMKNFVTVKGPLVAVVFARWYWQGQ